MIQHNLGVLPRFTVSVYTTKPCVSVSGDVLPKLRNARTPFTLSVWPLTQLDSGPARNATTLATSSGSPRRLGGCMLAKKAICCSVLPWRNMSVLMGDGVHGDLARTELLGERAADLLDRALRGDVEHVVGRDRGRGGKRGREEDDATA